MELVLVGLLNPMLRAITSLSKTWVTISVDVAWWCDDIACKYAKPFFLLREERGECGAWHEISKLRGRAARDLYLANKRIRRDGC